MKPGTRCRRHPGAEASFLCNRCGQPYCAECRCELLDDVSCCAECAVETAGANGGQFQAHQDAGVPVSAMGGRKRPRMMLLKVVLVICLPILAAEILFLNHSRTESRRPRLEARRVMVDTLMLVTELNRYRRVRGEYPERLEQLVPSFWGQEDRRELESYEYRRIGFKKFTLKPKLTGNADEDAGIVMALADIPDSLSLDTSLDVFLKPGGGP